MNTPRTMPNLIDEAKYLTDEAYAYGASILGRAVGHALADDGTVTPRDTGAKGFLALRTAAREYGPIVGECVGDNPTRRHLALTDAADVARNI